VLKSDRVTIILWHECISVEIMTKTVKGYSWSKFLQMKTLNQLFMITVWKTFGEILTKLI